MDERDQGSRSPIELMLPARTRTLDSIRVGRVLPAAQRSMVGPFIFFDHMGPAVLAPGQGLDVRPHPHINLATVTYLFEGEIVHRDSLGCQQSIRPGEINWMTAGRGIVHSERTSAELRQTGSRVHGIQLWVALPRAHEQSEPAFQHVPEHALPLLESTGVRMRLLAGSAYGRKVPVPTLSALFYVDVAAEPGATFSVPAEHDQRACYVVEGAVRCGQQPIPARSLAVFARGEAVELSADGPARLVLLGGAELDGPRHIFWNFVSSSTDRIEQAKRDWKEGRFPKVPGDEHEFIPLPE